MLRINRNATSVGQFLEVDAVTLSVEAKLYTVMNQALAAQAIPNSRLVEKVDCALFQHARTDSLFHVLTRLYLDDDRLYALEMKQVRKQQASRSRPYDSDLCMHSLHRI